MFNTYAPNAMTTNGLYQTPLTGMYQNMTYGSNYGRQEIVKVNGENGARAFQMPANSSAILLDENNPLIWLVQTDGAGYKTITPYTITPYQDKVTFDVSDIEARVTRLEEMINAKSNTSSTKSKKQSDD